MCRLKNHLKTLIQLNGPIKVSTYMHIALQDPKDGYYQTKLPFGQKGDFITAPEISQLFGEIIGVFLLKNWQSQKPKAPLSLAEIGPGRGTLMQDILRTIKTLDPNTFANMQAFLLETSPRLIAEQKTCLAPFGEKVQWMNDFAQLPPVPLQLVANELFDALAIDQYIKIKDQWFERLIGLSDEGNFCFCLSPAHLPVVNDANALAALPSETILEISPIRQQLMEKISLHIMQQGGTAVLIDYGEYHTKSQRATGDTLQALSHHKPQDIFAAPGVHDLTSHVDFTSLCAIAQQTGCRTKLLQQGDFLIKMGLLERAGALGHGKSIKVQNQISSAVERLAAPSQMGTLFKVLIISQTTIAPL